MRPLSLSQHSMEAILFSTNPTQVILQWYGIWSQKVLYEWSHTIPFLTFFALNEICRNRLRWMEMMFFLYLFIKRTQMTFSPLSFRVGTNAKGLPQIHSCFVIFVQKHSWRQYSRGANNLSPPMNGTFGYAFVAMMKTVTIIFASFIYMWNWYQRLCMALVYILSVPLCLTHARDMSKTQPSKKYNLSNLSIWPLSQLQTFTCRNGSFCLYMYVSFLLRDAGNPYQTVRKNLELSKITRDMVGM